MAQKDRQKEFEEWIEEKEQVEKAHLEKIHSELSPYIEKIEKEPYISTDLQSLGVTSDSQRSSSVIANGPTIILPLTEEEVKSGLHHKIIDAIRWLAEWCLRIAEIARKRGMAVFFGKDYISDSKLSKLERIEKEDASAGSI